jgi:heme-degrading monooxygenase HmoA
MLKFEEMDETVRFFTQMEEGGGPVVLVNKFSVEPEQAEQLIDAWAADAAVMRRQPGYISTQLHRGIAGSGVFLNYAVWESTAHFKRAFADPEFQNQLSNYPSSTVASPHLFRKIAVAGVCVA